MRKYLRLVLSSIMMVALLVFNSAPVMAQDVCNDDKVNEVSGLSSILATSSLTGEFHYTGRLAKGKNLGSVNISASSRTVKWTTGRTGESGTVILKITNQSTGETRSFTTTANNQLSSLTWNTKLPSGTYTVSVGYTSSYWLYDADLYFYS